MQATTCSMLNIMVDLSTNLKTIQQRIAYAEQIYQRSSGAVTLLAVSKGHSAARVASLYDAGLRHFGENYVQEALGKISTLSQKNIIWHFIGQIQTNKARWIAQNFSWVHTVSRFKEAQLLCAGCPTQKPPLNICIQVKLDPNPHKGGILPAHVFELIPQIQTLPQLRLRGLMTVPPITDDFKEQRHYFHLLHDLFQQLNQQGAQLDTLSMGMTHDLEAAIAEGATLVRIGTGLFGPRQANT